MRIVKISPIFKRPEVLPWRLPNLGKANNFHHLTVCHILSNLWREITLTASPVWCLRWWDKSMFYPAHTVELCTNEKCLATKHYQTLFGDQTFCRLATLLVVWSCLVVSDKILKAIKHSIKQLKTFLLFSCLMGDVLFRFDSRVSNMFDAYHACSAAYINCLISVWSNMF